MKLFDKALKAVGLRPKAPHEKAQKGKGNWGRQPEPATGSQDAKAAPKPIIHARVFRAVTGEWTDLGRIV